ncbi:MAG TPA: metalloregulator ArsR/SmtB family transcription factor, partial [bacterium]|nr:metalloregulator ArsR/SmtB family transcription factor [bacterium]
MNMDECRRLGELLKALGHPVRLKIVDGLMSHSCNVGEIVDGLGLPQSTVSQHLAVLRTR